MIISINSKRYEFNNFLLDRLGSKWINICYTIQKEIFDNEISSYLINLYVNGKNLEGKMLEAELFTLG